jgi:hypothetical protein
VYIHLNGSPTLRRSKEGHEKVSPKREYHRSATGDTSIQTINTYSGMHFCTGTCIPVFNVKLTRLNAASFKNIMFCITGLTYVKPNVLWEVFRIKEACKRKRGKQKFTVGASMMHPTSDWCSKKRKFRKN